ncbi:UNVERIFIED_ORG: aromatic-L-amino-acid decarboxylase [Xanthobacter viscosus]|jgi:aromatic-L-amino-acid decarboxylase|uniref:Aspartate aminotransferase family protein n=1 Tax=Xanthobacter autotrophicus TaxID=280 RepID=A0A6C1KBY4_XANAU|nr:pyridoxal-dependent decarboxylase [Xanthobacter autotrophicus]TLX41690.1 aspartate aminotransferase family protein [Xanthobacter autotrophicus]
MKGEAFRHWALVAANWAADYRAGLKNRPVRAGTKPGEIAAQLPTSAPEEAEPMADIFADFERILVPGMTHWQHPRFFAYFPANASPASVIGEFLSSAMGAQCLLWQTSPAATELEIVALDWLRQAVGLPEGFSGVIQDSASSATLCAFLTMRERALGFTGNRTGLSGRPQLRVYTSSEVHSSIDRAAWFCGIGDDNLVRIPTQGPLRSMVPEALEAAIQADKAAGFVPAGVVACVGGTSTGAMDDVAAVVEVAHRYGLFVHVDAAWAGSAMVCPEFRPLWAGVEQADSIVLNPHKWLGVQFDCSAHFLRSPDDHLATLAIQPEYLKTHAHDGIVNFSEWTIQLGRRFRALKLWFVLRAHGLEGLRQMIRNHVGWSQALAARIAAEPGFALASTPVLSLFAFRHDPGDGRDGDAHMLALLQAINDGGQLYLTPTRVDGRLAIRFQAGSMEATEADVDAAFDIIRETARALS